MLNPWTVWENLDVNNPFFNHYFSNKYFKCLLTNVAQWLSVHISYAYSQSVNIGSVLRIDTKLNFIHISKFTCSALKRVCALRQSNHGADLLNIPNMINLKFSFNCHCSCNYRAIKSTGWTDVVSVINTSHIRGTIWLMHVRTFTLHILYVRYTQKGHFLNYIRIQTVEV